jgi:diguanylate cyclase (GGDEF)-like protein
MPVFSPELKIFMKRYRIEFVVSAIVLIAAFELSFGLAQGSIIDFMKNDIVRPAYNIVLIVLSAFMFLIALVSYPKIYKFKILLSSYALLAFFICYLIVSNATANSIGIGDFKVDFWRDGSRFTLKFLITVLSLNLLATVLSQSTMNYNKGKNIAITMFFVNIAVCFFAFVLIEGNYFIDRTTKTGFLKFAGDFVDLFNRYALPVNFIMFMCMAVLSVFNIEEEHNYGSIIMALASLNFYLLIPLIFTPNGVGYYKFKLMLPIMAIIIIIGIFVHWMSCLHHKAHYDPLLKIYNRQHMDSIISGVADVKMGNSFSVLMCDIDHFKDVNDTYGHAAGDEVLFRIAQIIRDSSLPEGVVCRYGGEEIIVFLRGKTDEEAKSKAEKIRKAVKKESVKYKNKTIKVTMSIGLASTDKGLESFKKMIKIADDNVYKAKKRGRDRVVAE